MTKREYLEKLARGLRPLPKEERRRQLDYYEEMLSDRMDEGLDETAAVAATTPVKSSSISLSWQLRPGAVRCSSSSVTAVSSPSASGSTGSLAPNSFTVTDSRTPRMENSVKCASLRSA